MSLTPQQQRILAAVQQRTQTFVAGTCPLCRHKAWTVADGIIRLTIGGAYSDPTLPVARPMAADGRV